MVSSAFLQHTFTLNRTGQFGSKEGFVENRSCFISNWLTGWGGGGKGLAALPNFLSYPHLIQPDGALAINLECPQLIDAGGGK
jgi:hypothetical protein